MSFILQVLNAKWCNIFIHRGRRVKVLHHRSDLGNCYFVTDITPTSRRFNCPKVYNSIKILINSLNRVKFIKRYPKGYCFTRLSSPKGIRHIRLGRDYLGDCFVNLDLFNFNKILDSTFLIYYTQSRK